MLCLLIVQGAREDSGELLTLTTNCHFGTIPKVADVISFPHGDDVVWGEVNGVSHTAFPQEPAAGEPVATVICTMPYAQLQALFIAPDPNGLAWTRI